MKPIPGSWLQLKLGHIKQVGDIINAVFLYPNSAVSFCIELNRLKEFGYANIEIGLPVWFKYHKCKIRLLNPTEIKKANKYLQAQKTEA